MSVDSRNSSVWRAAVQEKLLAAVTAHRQGRLQDAEINYEAALRLDRNHFESLHNLGLIRLQQGKAEEARQLLRRATQQRPKSAVAHNNLGLALDRLGFKDEAAQRFEKALALDPNLAEAHNNLGASLKDTRPEEAIGHFEKAVALKPDYAEAHNNLGSTLQALRRPQDAADCYRRAISLAPAFAEAHHNLGLALEQMRRLDEAIPQYERAVAIKSDFAQAQNDLGVALQSVGRIDEARRALERAVELTPHSGAYYRNFSMVKRFVPDDPHLPKMEVLLDAAASDEEKTSLCFALGKAYADIGAHERSFGHLLEGNALKRRMIAYDEREMLDAFGRIRAAFPAERITALSGEGDRSEAPVFVLGMPRSGSTLTEQILAGHPGVFAAGETNDLLLSVAALRASRQLEGYPAMVSALDGDLLHALGTDYVARLTARSPGASRITDKLPENFLYIGLIHLALPKARIIHTRRNPIDTCLSCFSNLFIEGSLPYTYDLGELGRYYRAYDRLMAHWRAVLPPAVMLEIRYEEVVANLEHEARKLIAFCGLEWDAACLEFHKLDRPVTTASATQVRQPIYGSSVERWRPYEPLLGSLFEGLGPELAPTR